MTLGRKPRTAFLSALREELLDKMEKLVAEGYALSSPEVTEVSVELDAVVRALWGPDAR